MEFRALHDWEMSILMIVPYDHRLEPIDEQLVKLIAERMRVGKGANGQPTKAQFDRWAEEHGIDPYLIAPVFAAMSNPRRPPRLPSSPENLLDVIPVMQKVTVDWVTYHVTRMEQYADFSLVYVEIYTSDEADASELNVQLMLNVEPGEGRQIQFHRSQGQTNQTSVAYTIHPRLPADVASFKFQLVPHVMPHHPRPPELILDKPVLFD